MIEEIQEYIDGQYGLLKRYKHKANKQILYNIIYAKHKYGIDNYKQTLYLDIKKFVQSYITAADSEVTMFAAANHAKRRMKTVEWRSRGLSAPCR